MGGQWLLFSTFEGDVWDAQTEAQITCKSNETCSEEPGLWIQRH